MIYRVPEYIHARTIDDEVIIFDARNASYLGLNPTGATVWDVLASGRPLEDAVEALVTLFDVDQETAEEDVAVLVHQLRNLDLLSPLAP